MQHHNQEKDVFICQQCCKVFCEVSLVQSHGCEIEENEQFQNLFKNDVTSQEFAHSLLRAWVTNTPVYNCFEISSPDYLRWMSEQLIID